jgi:NAD(P)-dependent dehydrogenase (short-subunit alcohol dehydrogenase family)
MTKRTVHYDFGGRTAIVTGAAHGIGVAIAARLHRAGAGIALWDVDSAAVAETARSIGDRTLAHEVDITDEAAVQDAANRVVERFGRVDILINNAGILGPVATTWEHRTEEFRRVLDVNLTGAFICCRVVVPIMLAQPPVPNRGRIVNVSSIQAKEGMPRAAAYAASKAGLIALTKTLGKELAESGILVNAVTPAIAETRMASAISPERRQEILARIPMRRFVGIDEIADQVAWLCSDECSFATGATFDLSGGRATY